MKKILLAGILSLLFANSLADQTITCKLQHQTPSHCDFSGVTIGPNETVSIETDPVDADYTAITFVEFSNSSIHSVPSELFTKFPNLQEFWAQSQKIQEIEPETFQHGRKLEWICLGYNELTSLHPDTFKGKFLASYPFHHF
jgi:hypothetical protein